MVELKRIWKTSMISAKQVYMDLPVTNEQIEAWQNGALVQNAMPHLNEEQREFLMTGITPEEWKEHFNGV